MTENCNNCRFFKRRTDGDTTAFATNDGMCRRHAPSGFTPEGYGLLFPPMNSGQWCGEHQSRNVVANDTPPAAPAQAIAA